MPTRFSFPLDGVHSRESIDVLTHRAVSFTLFSFYFFSIVVSYMKKKVPQRAFYPENVADMSYRIVSLNSFISHLQILFSCTLTDLS